MWFLLNYAVTDCVFGIIYFVRFWNIRYRYSCCITLWLAVQCDYWHNSINVCISYNILILNIVPLEDYFCQLFKLREFHGQKLFFYYSHIVDLLIWIIEECCFWHVCTFFIITVCIIKATSWRFNLIFSVTKIVIS